MFLRAKVDSKTRQIVFIENKDVVAGISGDYNVDGVIFMLPENEDYFEFLNASVIRVIFFTPDGASHNQVLISRDEVYGMPKWTFDNNILSLDHAAYIKFFIVLTKTNLSGQILKSWNSMPNSLLFLKNRDYDNQEEQAAMDTEIDRLAGLVTELTSKAASIGDVESLLETITGSSPQPAATVSDLATADPTKLYLVAADGRIYYYLNNQWNPGPVYGSYSLDSTLTQSGQAADAKAVGDRISTVEEDLEDVKEDLSALEAQVESGDGLTEEIKRALLSCFAKVAWTDEHGQDYYDALEDALYPPANLVSISAVYTQSGTVYGTDSLDSLKPDLVVTAHYSDSSTATVTAEDYTLSGTLVEGTSAITVNYGGKTTTFDVFVSGYWDYEWDYTMGKLEDQDGWTVDSSGGSTTLISDSEHFTTPANTYYQIHLRSEGSLASVRKMPDGVGVIEISFRGHFNHDGTTNKNIQLCAVGSTTNRIAIIATKNKFRIFDSNNIAACTAIGDYEDDTDYILKIVCKGVTADVYVNGEKIGSDVSMSTSQSGTSNNIMAHNLGTGYYFDLKYLKIRVGAI